MAVLLPKEHDQTIYQEMMSHPALFSHGAPKTVGIIGDQNSLILQEVLKHKVEEVWQIIKITDSEPMDARIRHVNPDNWTDINTPFDVLIVADNCSHDQFTNYFNKLSNEGILIQECDSPFQIQNLILVQSQLKTSGFGDIQTLNFPQPAFPTGWRSAFMAKKKGIFKKIREKDIFNKPFETYYYNFDVHKAALVLPEFMRHALMNT